jgi:quercetin dioxygenase-like cupin family protein
MKEMININTSNVKEIIPGFKARFIHTQNNTISFVEIEEGAVLPEHHHVHEQTTMVVEGKLELTVNGKTTILEPNMAVVIPPNVPHNGKALTKCVVKDIFYPVREDYQ